MSNIGWDYVGFILVVMQNMNKIGKQIDKEFVVEKQLVN